MRRCTNCFRFHPGTPTYCSFCGRSFNVRICSRGHHNARGVKFCTQCGSGDLSDPAPPASLAFHLSGFALYLFSAVTLLLAVGVLVLALLNVINWELLAPKLLELIVMVGLLYWATTLLPGPIKRLGKAAGKSGKKH